MLWKCYFSVHHIHFQSDPLRCQTPLNIWLFIQKKVITDIRDLVSLEPAKWWSSLLQALSWTAVCRQLQASCGALPSCMDPDWITAEHGLGCPARPGQSPIQVLYCVLLWKCKFLFFREKKTSFFLHYLILVMASLRWRFNHSGICRANNV